ncbi:MAG: ATP-binding protein, partial [Planctomycetaceae bacterium]|nr:ATP-binding protein [Planctomycetaceae bacterium]
LDREQPSLLTLEWAFDIAQSAGLKIFVIIDEYDHFATDLVRLGVIGGNDFYSMMVQGNGLVRSFYTTLKIATASSVVNRTFITGISPMMLDDLTSGYNISANYSLNEKYNEMLGFTRDEVNTLMEETGVDANMINIDMEYYYNGYLFNARCENKVYNSSMILYIFYQILNTGEPPAELIDPNLGMDIGRLRHLVKKESSRKTLMQIMTEGSIVSNILVKFRTEPPGKEENYFISLLFYMGYLTIKESYLNGLRLVIPNFSIRTVYWEYMRQLVQETSPDTTVQESLLTEVIYALAMEGNIHRFIDYVSKNAFSKLSDYDLQHFDEKYIKVMLLAYLFLNNIYIPISEYEVDTGRIDIFLQRNPIFPEVKYEWVLELKYCKTTAKKSEIAEKRREGLKQLNEYIQSHHLKDRPNLKSALIIFIGKDKYEIITEEK